jgi:hypothetical protein
MFRRHPQADQLTPDTARRILSRYYGRYDAAYRDNAPKSLLAHYREVLSPDFVFIISQKKPLNRAAFLAYYERQAKEGRFLGWVAVLEQQTTLGAVEMQGDTIRVHLTERRMTFEYDGDAPMAGPDGLSGNPQPQRVVTVLRFRDTWIRRGDIFQMTQSERHGGNIEASYIDGSEVIEILKRLRHRAGL